MERAILVRPQREKCHPAKFACASGSTAETKPMSLIEG
jgi:hypothetical protein